MGDGRTGHRRAGWVRLLARIWSLFSLGFVLLIFVGEGLSSAAGAMPRPSEWIGLLLFPATVCIGLVVAWRNGRVGGALALLGLATFYLWSYLTKGRWPVGPYFALVAAPGLLFLITDWIDSGR
jgi:hypothetical protein